MHDIMIVKVHASAHTYKTRHMLVTLPVTLIENLAWHQSPEIRQTANQLESWRLNAVDNLSSSSIPMRCEAFRCDALAVVQTSLAASGRSANVTFHRITENASRRAWLHITTARKCQCQDPAGAPTLQDMLACNTCEGPDHEPHTVLSDRSRDH
jgi:hypothetical protein